MKYLISAALAFLLAFSTQAISQDEKTFASNFTDMQFDVYLGGAVNTENMTWGISGTSGDPGWYAYIQPSYGPFYFTFNPYPIKDPGVATMEFDYYFGFRPVVGDFQFDFSVYYWSLLPGDDDGNYWGQMASVRYDVTSKLNIGTIFWYTDNYFNQGFSQKIYEFEGKYKITDKLTFSALYGFSDYEVKNYYDKDYQHWNAGFTYQLTPMIRAEVRYWDTDRTSRECFDGRDVCSERVVGALYLDTSAKTLLEMLKQ